MKSKNKPKRSIEINSTKNIKMVYLQLIIRIILLIIVVSMSICLINSSININTLFSYTENGNIDYKVYLKENNFYKDKYLGKGMSYVASILDYIDIDFNYNFNTNKNADMNYTYSIFADLVICSEDNSTILFNERYTMEDKITGENSTQNHYNVSKTIKLDYNYYNNIANMFKSTYGLNCNSKLIVEMLVDTHGQDLEYETEFNNSNNMKIAFALAKKQVDIDINSASIEKTETINIKEKNVIKNKGNLMIGITCAILTILNMVAIVKNIYEIRASKDGYTRYIDKILNDYDRAIVEAEFIPNLDDYDVIELKRFEELLDVRDTLRLPIIYVQIQEREKESCFYIRHEHTIYIHYVKSTSLAVIKKNNNIFA